MVAKTVGKIPPQALDVEEAILGSLMIEPDAITKISGIINRESFYKQSHQKVFDCIHSIYAENRPIDLITVTQKLRERGELDQVGGALTVTQLTRNISSAAHIEHHARIIQQLFIQRELIRIGTETVNNAFDEASDIEELLSNLKNQLNILEDYSLGANYGQSQKEVIQEALDEMNADCLASISGKQPGITTGLFDVNQATGGWRNTNFILIAARPGVGKTSLALHLAKVAAKSGKWVNFYGLEMKSSDLMRIQISGESGINRSSIRDGHLSDEDWNGINACLPKLVNLPIIWSYYAGITADGIRAQTIRNRKKGKCDLIIIDYLQLITTTDKKSNREQQIAEISRTLKRLALSENIPIIALAQLNREAENVRPQLNHLRESGSLEQDADIVIFPWREDDKYNLTIAKNRRGKKGTFEIYANEEMTVFGDISHKHDLRPLNRYEVETNLKF